MGELTVDVTPPGVSMEDFDARSVIGQEFPLRVGDGVAGTAVILDAEVLHGRLIATLGVPREVEELVADQAIGPPQLSALEQFAERYGPGFQTIPPPVLSREERERMFDPVATTGRRLRARYGQVEKHWQAYAWREKGYRPVVRLRGGFRTRYRVRWARVLLEMMRPGNVRSCWDAQLEMLTGEQLEADRRRVCPHMPSWVRRYSEEEGRCEACGEPMAWDPEQGWSAWRAVMR